MQMIQCRNCGKLTGFKRSLGLSTFFMVLITCGVWLLVLPFYPLRCISCGMTAIDAQNTPWYVPGDTGSKIVVAILGFFFLLIGVQAILYFIRQLP